MGDFLLIVFIIFTIVASIIYAQQNYTGNTVMSCKGINETGTTASFLYSCNGEKHSCRAFLIFRSHTPYNSVSSISKLLSSDPDEIFHINNISRSEFLDQNQELIVPVNCSCSGQYYRADTSYVIPSKYDTYFTIANNTYQGLSTCSALVHENIYNTLDLVLGLNLRVPLRCACPTRDQTRNGVKYLVTYLVTWGGNVSTISARFSVSGQSTAYANGLSENSVLNPFTTILIPLPKEPSSFQTRTIKRAQTEIFYPKHKISYISLFIGVGIGVSLAVLCFTLFIVLKHKKENERCEVLGKGREGKQNWNLPEHVLENIVGMDQMIKVYEFEELVAATENFSSRRRLSNYVYKGVVRGKLLAIKEMRTDISKEVKFHAKINHFNLISLTGVCKHHQLSYLVFEFMENGSLKEWLFKDDNLEAQSWNCRIHIALDIADGLDYIHNFTAPAYVHNNISSNRILLNRDLRAKISNFSLARSADCEGKASSSMKFAEGRNGYLAPEYLQTGQVTPKIDIYAFGIVLLEIITGKGAVFEQDGKEVLLSETVLGIMDEQSKTQELTDTRLQVKHPLGYIIQQTELVLRLVKLCVACLVTEPERRPSAAEIISTLIKIQSDVQN
ncbi:protein LYK5-like [Lycium ferocissimum]|uniref:protein LYK5-like n=1 Tax=Lycium ferocissimum TaxID=112874 RepID=UPI0028157A16|nr:protein LYK5-like [Lycium ferocissimum]